MRQVGGHLAAATMSVPSLVATTMLVPTSTGNSTQHPSPTLVPTCHDHVGAHQHDQQQHGLQGLVPHEGSCTRDAHARAQPLVS